MTNQFKPATHVKCGKCDMIFRTFSAKFCSCKCYKEPGTLESDLEAACRELGIETAEIAHQMYEYLNYIKQCGFDEFVKDRISEIIDKLDAPREKGDG